MVFTSCHFGSLSLYSAPLRSSSLVPIMASMMRWSSNFMLLRLHSFACCVIRRMNCDIDSQFQSGSSCLFTYSLHTTYVLNYELLFLIRLYVSFNFSIPSVRDVICVYLVRIAPARHQVALVVIKDPPHRVDRCGRLFTGATASAVSAGAAAAVSTTSSYMGG